MVSSSYLAPDFKSQGDKQGRCQGHNCHESADNNVDECREESGITTFVEELEEPVEEQKKRPLKRFKYLKLERVLRWGKSYGYMYFRFIL